MGSVLGDSLSASSSFQNGALTPRTPRSSVYVKSDTGLDDLGNEDEVEATLLGEEERRRYALDDDGFGSPLKLPPQPLSLDDKKAMVLLCILYLIQGVPLGLALGSMPFILQNRLSYSQLGTFALCGYPYSLKLLWSPIIDSIFYSSLGRRKSWIIPLELISGTLMLYISFNVQRLMDDPSHHVTHLTIVFTALVFFSATQDIAVDGWALTLLSPENLSYASICQTIGLNSGYFISYTVFLAFNNEAIAQRWGVPRLTLSAYLMFWCLISYCVSLWLLLFKNEKKETANEEDLSIKEVYKTIWTICKMRQVQALVIMFVFGKIGFAANDAATSLKMVEKGLRREDLAVAVLINFPFQILGGWLVGTWSRGEYPLNPWLLAFYPRIFFALSAMLIVYMFPDTITPGFFVFLVIHTVLTSFMSTIQFVGSCAFFTRISDPVIGGTYMTLLNTFSNIGTMWPKWFVLKSVDLFTIATCEITNDIDYFGEVATECVSQHGKALCAKMDGECVVERDGYYLVTTFCMAFGVAFLLLYTVPTARRL